MKIILITLNYKGGMVHYTSQLSNALSIIDKITVITPYFSNKELFNSHIQVIEYPMGNTIKNFLKFFFNFSSFNNFLLFIRKENPDVIHIQSTYLWTSLFLPFLRRYVIITTIHDTIPLKGTPWPTKFFDQTIGQLIHIFFSDCIVIHDNFAKKHLESSYFIRLLKRDMSIIPIGNFSFFVKSFTENIFEENSILFFGRISEYKGLHYLIQSMTLVNQEIPGIKLIVAGEGDFSNYEELVKEGNFEIINRYIEDSEIPNLFKKSKMIILPYTTASQTGIIPIAYSFSKPVIVTNVGGLPESVDNYQTGIIVEPKDEVALANAIIYLLKNDDIRIKMGIAANGKMTKELSWDSIAKKTRTLYKKYL